jgi:hypothetical protein
MPVSPVVMQHMRFTLLVLGLLLSACIADPHPPCSEFSSKTTNASQLRMEISRARIAALEFWLKANGASPLAEQCEMKVWEMFRQLVGLQTTSAAENAAALLLDSKLSWHTGDALKAADAVVPLGHLITPYLRAYTTNSRVAELAVECIDKGYRRCL